MTLGLQPVARRLTALGHRHAAAWLYPAVTAAVALAAAGYVGAVDPNHPGHYPTCPFYYVTGWYCPGCGSLRAVHDLVHGDLHGGLARNPLTVLALPYLVWSWSAWAYRAVTGRPRRLVAPARLLWGLLALVLLFWLLRNLPGFGWLGP